MLVLECSGTPYEIGYHHGKNATLQISRSISFYASLFLTNCAQTWAQVHTHAAIFEAQAKEKWPALHEEMRGIADGAGCELLDIVALNVRTEINFGLFSDGCTSVAWCDGQERAWLGQNWDWMTRQKENLIVLKITQSNKPTLLQVTEAGILGKIGFNSSGVGACFNAIRIHGMDPSHLPAHFGLRLVLESSSVSDAIGELESYGMASSAHILIADTQSVVGLEFTKSTFRRCEPDAKGKVVHTNHMMMEHEGEVDTVWLKDSLVRVRVMEENVGRLGEDASWEEDFSRLFEDEQNYPGAICRAQTEETGSATLFNIVMDLKRRKAVVRLGRPTETEETIVLQL